MASDTNLTAIQAAAPANTGGKTVFKILLAISFCHLLNDTVQSLIPAIYPILRTSFHLNLGQIGLIALTSQVTASLLQPLVGLYTDRRPQPYSLAVGMGITLIGLLAFSMAPSFGTILVAAALVGIGSSVCLSNIGTWLSKHRSYQWKSFPNDSALPASLESVHHRALSNKKVAFCLAILVALMFSKFFYLASLISYYTFYLMNRFHLSVHDAQLHLSLFLGAVAAGTFIGGPVGDKIGRKFVIWCSILGVLPFTLVLPYANLLWTTILSVVIGFILASAFSAILVYAQELMPGRVGAVSGLFFGFAFGLGGVGAALLGKLADLTDLNFVYHVCSFLPAIGILTAFLPNLDPAKPRIPTPAKSTV